MSKKTDLERVRYYKKEIEFYSQVVRTFQRLISKIESNCAHEYTRVGHTHGGDYEQCQKCDDLKQV